MSRYYMNSVGSVLQQGRQEDAEEFLSCVLNHMHDEMLAITDPKNPEDASK